MTRRSGPIGSVSNSATVASRKTSRRLEATTATSAIRRAPSAKRSICTITWIAELIWSRSASNGMCRSLIVASVSRRWIASSQELACTVTSEPSWPVLSAWSMSSVSPPRTSPTMMRSGRMRSELRTRSRIETSPRPSTLDGRASSVTTCGCCRRSSALSSTVMMRSPPGTAEESAFSSVVLPAPVPPEITTLSFARTSARSSSTVGASIDDIPVSCSSVNSRGKRRMVSVGPLSASGGMITLTRSPVGSRASTIGLDSSTRRLTCETMRSIVWYSWPSSVKTMSARSIRPSRST